MRLNLAETFERNGEIPEAAEILEWLVAKGPPRAEVYARLARI